MRNDCKKQKRKALKDCCNNQINAYFSEYFYSFTHVNSVKYYGEIVNSFLQKSIDKL